MGTLILADVKKYLPEIVQDIVEIIGLENLENFLKQFGGVVFNFTKGKGYFPILEQTLGAELANKLQAYFSGEKNDVIRISLFAYYLINQTHQHAPARVKMAQNDELSAKFLP